MSMRMAEAERTAEGSRQAARSGQQTELVVKSRHKIVAKTADEMGIHLTQGHMADLSDDIRERAMDWTNDYKSSLIQRTELYLEQLGALQGARNGRVSPEEGEPTVGNYVGWDLITISPIQFEALPPYRPNKIVASGELSVLQSIMFINPAVSVPDGFAIPANIQLGNRDVRVSFDQFNLTKGIPGPNFTFVGNLGPAPVPPILIFQVFFIAPAVTSPELVEVNVTADVLNLGQPYATFATWHVDIEATPPFLGLAPVAPQAEYDIPQRYMVYPK